MAIVMIKLTDTVLDFSQKAQKLCVNEFLILRFQHQ